MHRLVWTAAVLVLLIAAVAKTAAPMPVFAEPLPEETRRLLEKSLSVYEIDREIERISKLRKQTERQIEQSKSRLDQQEIAVAVQREQAGRVLRSIYMGRQQFWLTSVMSVKSLSELFRLWETMDLVISSDRKKLNAYSEQYSKLLKGYEQLREDQQELASVVTDLESQRVRIAALQDEVAGALAGSGDADHLRALMDELQNYWNNVGLYEVKQHFRAIAAAMKKLPAWVKEHPEVLETKGLTTKLTITDTELNDFLRGEDSRFDSFSFTFDDGLLILDGDNGDMRVRIEGAYTVENEPVNGILFHVRKLVFNGLELPDTTRAELEREFDLGFYPQKLIKFVKAESVELKDGKLVVKLKVG